jgi:hypothetical protein
MPNVPESLQSLPDPFPDAILETDVFNFSRAEYNKAGTNPPPLCPKTFFLKVVKLESKAVDIPASSKSDVGNLKPVSLSTLKYGGIIQSLFFSDFSSTLIVYLVSYNASFEKVSVIKKVETSQLENTIGKHEYTGEPIFLESGSEIFCYAYDSSLTPVNPVYMTVEGGLYE